MLKTLWVPLFLLSKSHKTLRLLTLELRWILIILEASSKLTSLSLTLILSKLTLMRLLLKSEQSSLKSIHLWKQVLEFMT